MELRFIMKLRTICFYMLSSIAALNAFENPQTPAAPRWAQEPTLAQRSLQKIVENTDVTNLLVFIDNSAPSFSPTRLVDLAVYIIKADNFTYAQKQQLIDYLADKAKKFAKNTVETNLIEAMNSVIKKPEPEYADKSPFDRDQSLFDRIVSNHLIRGLPGVELFIPHLDLNQPNSLETAFFIADVKAAPLPICAQLLRSILRAKPNLAYRLVKIVYDWNQLPEAQPLLHSLLQEFRSLLNRPFENENKTFTVLDWLVDQFATSRILPPAQQAQLVDSAVKLLRSYGAKTLKELEAQEQKQMSKQDISVRDTPAKK